ncbi:MAG: cold-shock protein [Nitrospiraceae bacterium]|nr:MAG: cold-shock protein [Nitrospiraceae bacterium]
MPKREIGIVRWYDGAGGYGFIARKHGEDVYVHYSAVCCDGDDCALEEGDPVEFTVIEGENGPQAQEVVVKKFV